MLDWQYRKNYEVKNYVHFRHTDGKIFAVSNSKEPMQAELSCLEIDIHDARKFKRGEKLLSEASVILDLQKKEYKLLYRENTNISAPTNPLCEITANENVDSDCIIVQDTKNKNWRVSVSKDIHRLVQETKIDGEQFLHFFITKKNNPNALIRTLSWKLTDICNMDNPSIPFVQNRRISQYEIDKTAISCYTYKNFASYNLDQI